ncbi:ABC transporter permease [Actinomadura craniellae]|uniref:ABC transporter permease n=1 Tax=Actinomadura craniellae TaxID=2231787 RepID=A0A365H9H7_9ACTN|nr:ABC transporter permease [Actinomadura craniellae]RAY15606.1 ABC transporter permease [Actinomadura craniellae]
MAGRIDAAGIRTGSAGKGKSQDEQAPAEATRPPGAAHDDRGRGPRIKGSLGRFILVRLLLFPPTALGAGLFTFLLIKIIPGGPAYARLGENATPESVALIERQLGLDRPLPEQFLGWLGKVLTGDFGASFQTGYPVSDTIAETLPVTLELTFVAILGTCLIAIPVGVFAGKRAARSSGRWVRSISGLGLAVPDFFAALVLITIFSVWLRVLPRLGFTPFAEDPVQNLYHLILPALPMILGGSAIVIRQVGAAMADAMASDYVRTARAMGLSERRVTWHYAFRSVLPTVLNVVGLLALGQLGATLILEEIFVLPGLGRTLVTAIGQLDFPVILGVVLVFVFIALVVNLVVDIVAGLVDPAIRKGTS